MRKIFFTLFLIIFFAVPSTAEENRAYFPPVLMYHDIKLEAQNNFDVVIEDFCSQLDWLKENEYITLSMEDFCSYVREGKEFPEKSVLITFDDGYSGIFNYAYPELKKRGMKATAFIISDMLGVFSSVYFHITERQLKEMTDSGVFSVGSHTLTHPDFTKLNHDDMDTEIEESKKDIEEITGKKILAFAYPYGYYSPEIINKLKKAGYEAGFAVENGELMGEKARWSIPRIYMGMILAKDDNKLFKEFIKNYKDMPPEAFAERYEWLRDAKKE